MKRQSIRTLASGRGDVGRIDHGSPDGDIENTRGVSDHLRFKRPSNGAANYNAPQRVTYLAVIFGLVPLMIWTGLAISPGFTSVFPGV